MGKTSFLSFLSLLILLTETVSGQNDIRIQGKVTDVKGDPLIGANVIILNTFTAHPQNGMGPILLIYPRVKKNSK